MRGSDEIEAFWQGLPRWRRELGALPPSRLLPPAPDLAALARTVSRLERRHRDGPECPLRAAFFGPTGAGKSKIFNSLLGETVSPAGFHRPYTRRALFWVHEDWRPIVASLEGEIRTHARSEWRGVFLIDTPDFDSVELANRDEAERVFHEADLFLFVVDSLKYADASSWEWLERIHATGKPYRLVLNKVRAAEVTRDFAERIERVLGGGPAHPVIVLPDLPIDDDTPIPPDTPGLVELRELLLRSSSDPAETRRRNIELFARDLDKVFVRSRELLALIENRKKALERLHSAIAERARTAVGELEDRLITDVDPAVKRELYGRVLERIERLDVLRYPRRLLSLPAEGLRELWGRVSGRGGRAGREPHRREDSTEAVILASESFRSLEAAVVRLEEDAWKAILDEPELAAVVERSDRKQTRFDHDELLLGYRERYERFRAWAAEESRNTAAELAGQHKLKFVVSQVIFNSVLIGVQIKSFGAFSLLELGIDGVVSPLVAKAVGIAISNEKVAEFEARAHAEHHRLSGEIVEEARARIDRFLASLGDGLSALEETLEGIRELEGSRDAIAACFGGSEPERDLASREPKGGDA